MSEILFPLFEAWEITTLGEVCKRGGGNVQTGPFGSQLHAADYVVEGVPSIMPQNIGHNTISTDGIARISGDDAARLQRYLVKTGDIVYSRRGDVERRALVREAENGWLCGTGCLRIRFGEGVVHPEYAAQYLGHPNVREWIVRHAHGATMPNLNTGILSALPFVLPPIESQRAIASVLGALDDRIALNRRMNATLEAMARALFKDWFVDFGPVRAKMAGSAPTLAPELWYLFPSKMGEDGLPVGWILSTVGEQVAVRGGTTPSTKNTSFWEGGNHSWATPKDLSRLTSPVLFETERQITDSGLREIGSGLLPAGALLMSSRAPIGYFALAQMPCAMNQGFIGMVCDGALNSSFMLLWCKENMPAILSVANGSTFLEISRANFKPLPVVLASQNVLDAFYKQINPMFEQIVTLTKESKTLATLRDTLLPKLLSGELSVDTVEGKV